GVVHEAVLWNGPVLELVRDGRRLSHLGPDILERPPNLEEMLERFRAAPQSRDVGDAVLDQRLVAGIGNMWKAEALWDTRVSPWRAPFARAHVGRARGAASRARCGPS